ncbi:hypothetical protein [Acinetobacter beijerinckii]|uniref:hypothetical protein n=1 Tax=Acinetobacter beijerinckii TaxID=262668 RepID=UPI0024064FEE|nr:hypothetical protein [Acinetobacter beijerinckii]
MSKGRKHMEMLSREKLLPPTNQVCIKFISDKEMQEKIKNIDFFASKHISLPKK